MKWYITGLILIAFGSGMMVGNGLTMLIINAR